MNKTIVQVPEGITKLSQWTDFGNYLPEGRFVLNKKITGCGATTYFLENNMPVILCSHRTELLESKARSRRHLGKVHLFKDSKDISKKDLESNMRSLHFYLDSCNPDPFTGVYLIPKILVTTDSLCHVLDVLNERGILSKFTVVSDEMQCIFTDASFKGGSVINYIYNLKYIQNIVFLSATPYLEEYLGRLPEFRDLPYIELEWPPTSVEDTTLDAYYVDNLKAAAIAKIEFYKQTGYFEENGYCKATQAVFFINSITDIINIIKSCKLDPVDINIICSKTNKKTAAKLKRAKLSVGFAPDDGQPHVTYTFVTKCAYEGVDFYHPNAYTYIFSNPNLSNMAMDLSIDIIQILGRQRRDDNPWKNQAIIYYQTTKDKFKIPKEEFLEHQARKDKNTELAVNTINNATGDQKTYAIRSFNHEDGYVDDYIGIIVDSITGEVVAALNPLIRIAEERAYDIRNELYENKYQVLRGLCKHVNVNQVKIKDLNQYFIDTKDFSKRLYFYCYFRDNFPELTIEIRGSIVVPVRYHEYYEKLGTAKLGSVSYRESEIKKMLEVSDMTSSDNLLKKIQTSFTVGSIMSNKEAKDILQGIYDELGIRKVAKASELQDYYECQKTKVVINSKPVHGIKILSLKQ